jgi:hypothetical protein
VLGDLREALRQLRKTPGVTTTAVITLTLGIGATTAIFTLVHQVMLKSLPVTKPDELWRIGDEVRFAIGEGIPRAMTEIFPCSHGRHTRTFERKHPSSRTRGALQAGNAPLGVRRAGSPAQADMRNGEYVSGNFFRTLGVQPWIGRLMTDADDQEGARPVAVMSYRIWHEKYGADSSVVWRYLPDQRPPVHGNRRGAAGILWSEARRMGGFLVAVDDGTLINGATARLKRPNGNFLDLVGRIRPGVDVKSLEAKLKVELHDWLASHVPDMEPGEKQLWRQQTLHRKTGRSSGRAGQIEFTRTSGRRRQIATYKRFKRLIDQWLDLCIEHSLLTMQTTTPKPD